MERFFSVLNVVVFTCLQLELTVPLHLSARSLCLKEGSSAQGEAVLHAGCLLMSLISQKHSV